MHLCSIVQDESLVSVSPYYYSKAFCSPSVNSHSIMEGNSTYLFIETKKTTKDWALSYSS